MQYDNTQVRRQDRLLDEEAARSLLRDGEYGILSMRDENGKAYGLPINYVWDNDIALYIHCAPEGRKLRGIAADTHVSFCVVGRTHVCSSRFTTAYESVILCGKASVGLSEEERCKALKMLLDKYSPDDKETGLKYAEKSFHRTEIIRIDIEKMSGKCKVVK